MKYATTMESHSQPLAQVINIRVRTELRTTTIGYTDHNPGAVHYTSSISTTPGTMGTHIHPCPMVNYLHLTGAGRGVTETLPPHR